MQPREFTAVLWDVDPTKIDSLPIEFVTQRVLSYGTLGLIIKLVKTTSLSTVKEVFARMKPTAISPKKYHYLEKYLLA